MIGLIRYPAYALVFVAGFVFASSILPASGLGAKYYSNPSFSGPPVIQGIDRAPMTAVLEERTKDFLPTFAVEWSGFIVIHDAGPYVFSTTSDDGSELAIDDTFIVKNGGIHGPVAIEGRAVLSRGVHPIYIRYFQAGGGMTFELRAAREGSTLALVPESRFVPAPVGYLMYLWRQAAPFVSGLLAVAAFIWLAPLLRRRQRGEAASLGGIQASLVRPGVAIAVIVTVGVIARVLMMLGSSAILWPDSIIFLYSTHLILNGHPLDHDIFRTAIYPFFLAAFFRNAQTPALGTAVIVVQHLLGLGSSVMFYLVGRRAFTPLVAFYGALLFCVHSLLLFYEASILSEVLFIVALGTTLLAMSWLLERPGVARAAVVGLLCAVLTLVRPVGQWFALCVLPGLWMTTQSASRTVKAGIVIAAANLLLLTPWMMLNQSQYGFFGIAAGHGLGLFTRVFEIDHLPPPETTSHPDAMAGLVAMQGTHSGLANLVRDHLTLKLRYSQYGADEEMYQFALEAVLSHPFLFATHSLKQWAIQAGQSLDGARVCQSSDGPYLCSGRMEGESTPAFPAGPTGSRPIRSGLVWFFTYARIPMAVVFPCVLLGLLAYFTDATHRNATGLLLALTAAYFTLVPAMLQWPQDRYRLPVDALLFMFGAWGVRTLASASLSRTPSK